MNECHICFDVDIALDEFMFLECLHKLCKGCFNKLYQKKCPFCRTVINKEIKEPSSELIDRFRVQERENIYERSLRVRIRRRRRRYRTTTETVSTEFGTVSLEMAHKVPDKYSKKAKRMKMDNRKKGAWARARAHIR